MKIVYVEWLDARIHTGSETPKEAEKTGLMRMRAVGMLVGEDSQVLRLAMEEQLSEEPGSDEIDLYRRTMVIPVNSILRRQEVVVL